MTGSGSRGSLVFVGTGLQAARHTTAEAREEIVRAEQLFYLMADPVSEAWIRRLNPTARSLQPCYVKGESRVLAYRRMVDSILKAVGRRLRVCVALYGHPGVFVFPSHEAIRRARKAGFPARMLPGISAEDCLFADLGVDPARSGCQSFEATDFLVHRRQLDPSSSTVLWQVGTVGNLRYGEPAVRASLAKVQRALARIYGPSHRVVLYVASPYRAFPPLVESVALAELARARIGWETTIYVPPKPAAMDLRVLRGLGLRASEVQVAGPCWDNRPRASPRRRRADVPPSSGPPTARRRRSASSASGPC